MRPPSSTRTHSRVVGDATQIPFGGVEADTVGYRALRQLCPHAPTGQRAVVGNVERSETPCITLADDERPSIRRDDRAVGKSHVVGDDAGAAVGVYANQFRRFEGAAAVQIEAEVADVRAAESVDHHVVAMETRERRQIGNAGEAFAVVAQQAAVGHRDDEQIA